jgi:hypothetical protein
VPVAIGDEQATVRLYYYEQERAVTELARASIEDSVQRLAKTFDYVPERPIPYVLYSSYQEFLRTNLFPVQEGTLGVHVAEEPLAHAPYFGDRRLFGEVSTHELGHEFTIQKLAHVAPGGEGAAARSTRSRSGSSRESPSTTRRAAWTRRER